jgi:UDP-glucose 4-epimerase
MAVLVTGGAGYIGSHMVLRLCDGGQPVVVLDNLTTGFDWILDHRATFVPGNAGDTELVQGIVAEHKIDAIIHFAGSISVPESVADPLKYYGNNTATSRNLIEAAVKAGVKHFIFSSTAALYGDAGMDPVLETATPKPESPYARSKLMTEMMLADVAEAHPLTYGVLRYFNVAGADPARRSGQSSPLATHLIKISSQAVLGQRPHVGIFGTDFPTPDGTGVRDYIHVTDLIEAHWLLLNYLRSGGASATMNCGYGRGFSVREVIDTVKKVSGVDFKVIEEPRRAGDPAAYLARADKVRQVLGWKPAHDQLEEIVAHALTWERYLATRNR